MLPPSGTTIPSSLLWVGLLTMTLLLPDGASCSSSSSLLLRKRNSAVTEIHLMQIDDGDTKNDGHHHHHHQQKKQQQDGLRWSLFNSNKTIHIMDRGSIVPADVYTDLERYAKDVIGRDPFYRFGDQQYRWVAYENWTYSLVEDERTEALVAEICGGRSDASSSQRPSRTGTSLSPLLSELEFEGLQVVASIFVDNHFVGTTDNQFRKFRFDISHIVANKCSVWRRYRQQQHEQKPGNPPPALSIRIAFTSSVLYGEMQHTEYKKWTKNFTKYPQPDAPHYLHGLPYRNYVRGEQSSFGWDWGPAFAPQAITKPVLLRCYYPPRRTIAPSRQTNASREEVAVHRKHQQHQTPKNVQKRLKLSNITSTIEYVVPLVHSLPAAPKEPLTDSNNTFLIHVRVFANIVGSVATGESKDVHKRLAAGTNLNKVLDWGIDDDDCRKDVADEGCLRVAIVGHFSSKSGPVHTIANKTNEIKSVSFTSSSSQDDDGARRVLKISAEALVELHVSNADLWWPRGYGAATLHTLAAKVQLSDATTLVEAPSTKVGLRSIELITKGNPLEGTFTATTERYDRYAAKPNDPQSTHQHQEEDHPSSVMFFRVNGLPIFAKGANLIPLDAFPGRISPATTAIASVMESAIEANMNMIRVWGGGIYQDSILYEMADKLGVMIWQEMIFACSEYPVNPDFLENVRLEIKHQMRRLSRHPSIVVWSGNNENAEAYANGKGKVPYHILDYDTVMDSVIHEDNSRPIWPSSPSPGFQAGVTASGLPSGTLGDPDPLVPFPFTGTTARGDSHYYNYFSCPNISAFPKTHFGSEFGFQSLPWLEGDFESVSSEADGDWGLFSKLMHHRQHHAGGNKEIAALLRHNFDVDEGLFSTSTRHSSKEAMKRNFKRIIFLSQLQQTLCISNEAAFYRRGRNMPEYGTMGSLYWQLNQNWQAPSWTSVEYSGAWKVLHYAIRDVYDTFQLTSFYNASSDLLVAHVASDANHDLGHVASAATRSSEEDNDQSKQWWKSSNEQKSHARLPAAAAVATVELIPFKMEPLSNGRSSTMTTASKRKIDAHFVIDTFNVPVIPKRSGTFLWAEKKQRLLHRYQDRCRNGAASCFLRFSLYQQPQQHQDGHDSERSVDAEEEEVSSLPLLTRKTTLWLTESGGVKHLDLVRDVRFHVETLSVTPRTARLSIHLLDNGSDADDDNTQTAQGVALYVFLRNTRYPNGFFGDNGFTLLPGATNAVELTFTLFGHHRSKQQPAISGGGGGIEDVQTFQDGLVVECLNNY